MTDHEISLCLERVEKYSKWMTSDAETVHRNVRVLAARRSFDTKAHAAMQTAKERLETSLAQINEALSAYEAKPATA